jgi:colanic acid/amylovoran biosynthesis protein
VTQRAGSDLDPGAAPISRAQLRDAAVAGARWVAINRVAAEIVAFVSAVALARLLHPADFGHAAIPLILIAMATVLTFEGIGTALVQRPHLEREHLEAAELLSIALGLALAGVIFVLSSTVIEPLLGSQTVPLVRLAALAFVLAGFGVVPRAEMQRRLDFRRITVIEVAASCVNVAVSVALAAAGVGALALVIGAMAMCGVTSVMFLRSAPLTLPRFHRRAVGDILGFGLPTAASSLVWNAYRNVDYAIVGGRLGAVQLGYYWRAYQLGVQYQQKVSGIIGRLAFPILARASSADDMRALRFRMVRLNSAVIFPLLLLFVVVAPDVVPLVFGPQWKASVLPAQILAVGTLVAPVVAGVGPMMMASGRPKPMLVANVAFLALYGVAVYFAAAHGIVAVCLATVVVQVVKLAAIQYLLLDRMLGIPTRQVVADVKPALNCSLLLVVASLPVRWLADLAALPAALTVMLAGAAGSAMYLLALRRLYPGAWTDLLALVVRARRGSARAGAPRIAITNAVALNTGDAAILKSIVLLLRRALGERAEFIVYDSAADAAAARYPDLEFRPLPYERLGTTSRTGRVGRLARRARQARVLAAAWLWGRDLAALAVPLLSRAERAVLRECASVDAVVSTGGTYLVETYRLEPRLFELRLALALRKPLILYTQSLGPFRDPTLRRSLRTLLARAELVLLRDEPSREHLLEIGVPSERLAVSADAAFALADVDVLAATRARGDVTPRIAISVRRWHRFATADGMERYEQAIAELTTALVEREGAHVCFLSTCQGVPEYWLDDSAVAAEIVARLPAHVAARVTVDRAFHPPEALMERLQEFDLVVATRMHVAILALGAGVPVLPIAYEFKTQALFARLGFASLVVPIDDIDGGVLAGTATDVLRDRAAVRERLVAGVLSERERALASADLVRGALR